MRCTNELAPMFAPPPRWYALAVHARQERAAATELSRRGFAIYLPMRHERHAWSDRIKLVERAFFPGYVFVHTALSAQIRLSMLQARKTYDLVGKLPGD